MNFLKWIQNNIFTALLVVSFLLFILSQLIINSILAPLGTELQSLSSEKKYLQGENRGMEEEIAKSKSIIIIQELASSSLKLSSTNTKTVIYLEDDNLVASK
ncbi:hypothetical protein J6Z48_02280 [bacterium]|nr:hypothetical protein [bacterium]